MATITLFKERLKKNYEYLNQLFSENDVEWAAVTKLLCGNRLYLEELLDLGIKEVCDSRIQNLRTIKSIDESVQTVYIKPPALDEIEETVRYADVSFNSESSIIRELSNEAKRQNKTHKIIIMIELGDLREGIMGEHLTDFYEKIFELPNIKVAGLGSNLNCLSGVMPSQDKYIQMSLYKQLIEAKFNVKIPWVTGGTSVVIPLLMQKTLPKAVNHFRVGETLYFGLNLLTGEVIDGMEKDVLKLSTEIIELTEKPKVPIGTLAENPSGQVFEVDKEDYGATSKRAILDIGLLDVSPDYLFPDDPDIEVVNASSDMLIVDLAKNKNGYKVGDKLSFSLKYMGALSLLNSDYIHKNIA
ncbi:MAG: alanine/ornithine racemase family PLP-dependent enzyme [Bacteroidetes bacterium]|jgi:predicted amino acid racemase|nr:alanine/ornithine racemase family PLP-dependent enzyme [Bacteroidota bacterium]